MFKSSRGTILTVLAALLIVVLLAGCGGAATTTTGVTTTTAATTSPTPAASEPASVTINPSEAYNPIRTQHTLTAQVKDGKGNLVSGASVEWILNRSGDAVGDIVSMAGGGLQKVDNTYGICKTNDKGEAQLTITSLREGDTDVTAYVPAIKDAAVHKTFAVKHWLDMTAHFPGNAVNAVGTDHVLNVQTVKVSDGMSVGNVPVRFNIVGNDPKAFFKEAGAAYNSYTVFTDPYGFAAVTLQQVTPAQGTNTVRIDVLAPGNNDFVLVTKEVTKQWIATKIGLSKEGPEQIALLGEATYNIKVDNTGDLTANGVVLTDEIPAGMSYVSSDPAGTVTGNSVVWNVGSLNKTDSRSFKLVLKGTQAGLWTNTVVATIPDVGNVAAQATTRVLPAPEVVIKKTGPSGMFTGFTRTYTLAVTNTGAVALNDVKVTDEMPSVLNYESAIPSGTVSGNQIVWDLGTLNIGETKNILVILGGQKSGTGVNKATVTTKEGVTSTDSLNITVLGAPGAHMSLIDSSDPVGIGDEYMYTIKVLNQSEANSLHNMTIVGLLPVETTYVSADGPTTFTVVGKEVRFAAVSEIKPGATVEFHITVKATSAGAAVLNATMRWDEFGEAIVNQEGTTVFAPQP